VKFDVVPEVQMKIVFLILTIHELSIAIIDNQKSIAVCVFEKLM
jgi:hypothetical protein